MPASHVSVVTFTDTEAAAVAQVLRDLQGGGWRPVAGDRTLLERPAPAGAGGNLRLSHISRGAQGNVVVAEVLARRFAREDPLPDYIVFYGCAGTVDPENLGRVYLVARTHYLSLGTVRPRRGGESVTLKNKWIEPDVEPRSVNALRPGVFPLVGGTATRNMLKETTFPPALVLATDAVIRVKPDAAPPKQGVQGQPHKWKAEDWTWGQAMAHVLDSSAGMDALVEMESYGIAVTTRALNLGEHVIVMRVATDDLVVKDGRQAELLMRGRVALMQLLAVLYEMP
jgi:hypothetical protein